MANEGDHIDISKIVLGNDGDQDQGETTTWEMLQKMGQLAGNHNIVIALPVTTPDGSQAIYLEAVPHNARADLAPKTQVFHICKSSLAFAGEARDQGYTTG